MANLRRGAGSRDLVVECSLSLLAIAIGVAVFLLEQRRANHELEREAAREREAIERAEQERLMRHRKLVDAVLSLIDGAVDLLAERLDPGQMYIGWTADKGTPGKLNIVAKSLEALRVSPLESVELALGVQNAISIINAAANPDAIGYSPAVGVVQAILDDQRPRLELLRIHVANLAN